MLRALFRKTLLPILIAFLAAGCAGPRKAGNLPSWDDPRVRFVGTMMHAYQKATGREGERWYLGILPGRRINAYGPRGWFYIKARLVGHRFKGHIGTQRINTCALRGSVALGAPPSGAQTKKNLCRHARGV